jgi:hypothetical protein
LSFCALNRGIEACRGQQWRRRSFRAVSHSLAVIASRDCVDGFGVTSSSDWGWMRGEWWSE